MKPILIVHGSFDPFNDGHFLLLESLRTLYDCKKTFILINEDQKDKSYASFEMREKMVSLYLKDKDVTDDYHVYGKAVNNDNLLNIIHKIHENHPKRKILLIVNKEDSSFLNDIESKNRNFITFIALDRKLVSCFADSSDIQYVNLLPMPDFTTQIQNGISLNTSFHVMKLIADNELYFTAKISSMMKKTRYQHSVSVAKTAYKIALHNNLDPQKAFLTGLYHDCGKDIPIERQKAIIEVNFNQFEPLPTFAYHQFVGAYLAKHEFGINDEEILSSISCHCLGKDNMSEMEKTIYAADKVEPTRPFDNKKTRKLCYKNIDQGFVRVLKEQVGYFKKNNTPFDTHPLSKAMYKYYLGD